MSLDYKKARNPRGWDPPVWARMGKPGCVLTRKNFADYLDIGRGVEDGTAYPAV